MLGKTIKKPPLKNSGLKKTNWYMMSTLLRSTNKYKKI